MGIAIDTLTAEQDKYLAELGDGHLIATPDPISPRAAR